MRHPHERLVSLSTLIAVAILPFLTPAADVPLRLAYSKRISNSADAGEAEEGGEYNHERRLQPRLSDAEEDATEKGGTQHDIETPFAAPPLASMHIKRPEVMQEHCQNARFQHGGCSAMTEIPG